MERHRKQSDNIEFLFGDKECTANVHIRSENRYVKDALDVNTVRLEIITIVERKEKMNLVTGSEVEGQLLL